MGFTPQNGKNARRPGGGGGGRFAQDWVGTQTYATAFTMVAGSGTDGHPNSIGALSGRQPSAGGEPGQGPFVDASDDNDFFGVRPVVEDGQLTGLVRGELPSLWAGYGGGAGGNAGRRFPNPNWNLNSDEKGGGGGGAAGGLHIKALGRIVFGTSGQIVANGGRGATGENTSFLDHIGGTGGAGSGGHVILESATLVDFTDGGARTASPTYDIVLAGGPLLKKGPPAGRGQLLPGLQQRRRGRPGRDPDPRAPADPSAQRRPVDLRHPRTDERPRSGRPARPGHVASRVRHDSDLRGALEGAFEVDLDRRRGSESRRQGRPRALPVRRHRDVRPGRRQDHDRGIQRRAPGPAHRGPRPERLDHGPGPRGRVHDGADGRGPGNDPQRGHRGDLERRLPAHPRVAGGVRRSSVRRGCSFEPRGLHHNGRRL